MSFDESHVADDAVDESTATLAEARLFETMLGAAMRRIELAQQLIASGFSVDDCENTVHASMWRCVVKMHERGKGVDHRLVETALIDDGVDVETAREFIAACVREDADDGDGGANLAAYVEEIKRRVACRRLQRLGRSLVKRAALDDANPAEITAVVVAESDAILRGAVVMQASTGPELETLSLAALDDDATAHDFVAIGMRPIDAVVGGIPCGGQLVVTAREKTGKTTFAKHIGLHVAGFDVPAFSPIREASTARDGWPVLHISLEAQKRELAPGWASIMSGVNIAHRRRMGTLSDADVAAYRAAAKQLGRMPIYLEKLIQPTAEEVASLIYAHVRQHGIRLVIGDFIQNIAEPSHRFKNEERAHAHVAKVLTGCAERCPRTAFLWFSQNRDVDDAPRGRGKQQREPRNLVPQTSEWNRLAYLIGALDRPYAPSDARLKDATRFRLRLDRVTGSTSEADYKWTRDTARLFEVAPNATGDVPFGDNRHPSQRKKNAGPEEPADLAAEIDAERDEFING